MRKLTFLAGFAAGYVVGARAGRERYDQIAEKAQQVWKDPRVQDKVSQAQDVVKDQAAHAQDAVKDKAEDLVEKVKEQRGDADASSTSAAPPAPADVTPTLPDPTDDTAPSQTPTGRPTGYSGGGLS